MIGHCTQGDVANCWGTIRVYGAVNAVIDSCLVCSNAAEWGGGIYINNIEHIEHFHAPTDNSTDQSTSNTQVNAVVAAENADIIKELLLVFKGDAANAQSFLSSIRGALPTQVTALVNDLTMQNLIVKELRFKHLWHILNHHGLYAPTLQNWNKQIR